MVAAPAKRELVRFMASRGLSERRALQMAHMSASALRYCPRPDHNGPLREQILALAHQHRRYGAGQVAALDLRHASLRSVVESVVSRVCFS